MNRKALLGATAAVLSFGTITTAPAGVAHAAGSTVSITPAGLQFSLTSYQATSLPQTVTIKNTGSTAVTFQRNHIAGANPSEFAKQADSCSFKSLNAGASCQVSVAFNPRAYPFGARSATLDLVDDATTTNQSVKLFGTSSFDPPVRSYYVSNTLPCCSTVNTNVESISRGPGSDPSMWLTEVGQSQIGMIAANQGFAAGYSTGPGSKPYGLAVAPSDGNDLFFTDDQGSGRLATFDVSTHAVVTRATFPTAASNPGNITAGPDGNIWGVEPGSNRIFRYTIPSGPLTEFSAGLPAGSGLNSITRGPGSDTNLYFTMTVADKIGKISTGTTPTVAMLPTILPAGGSPKGIAAAPDANLWVTLSGGSSIVKVATDGTGMVIHPLPTTNSHPSAIAADALGNLYVTDAGKLSKVHFASGAFQSISDIPMPAKDTVERPLPGFGPVAVDASNNAWFSQWLTSSADGYVYQYVVNGSPSPQFFFSAPATVQFGNQADNTYSGDYSAQLGNLGTNDFHVTAATFGGADGAYFHLVSDGCTGHAVAPGWSCIVAVDFSPAAVRSYSATLNFTLTDAFGAPIASMVQSLAGAGTSQAPMTEFPIAAGAFGPCQFPTIPCLPSLHMIAPGPGSIVVAEPYTNRIGMLTTAGALSEWVVPTNGAAPASVAWDGTTPGNLWFTEGVAGQIGRLNLSTHAFTEYPLPTSDTSPSSIVHDAANGLMYFTASGSEGGFIDSISASGVITENLVPHAYGLQRLVVGGDGNLWAEEGGGLIVMTPSGSFPPPPSITGSTSGGLSTGPSVGGKPTIWYAGGSQVGYVTTDGTTQGSFTEPLSLGAIQGLTQGGGNTMYLTVGDRPGSSIDANKIAKVTLSGTTIGSFVDESIQHEDAWPAGITMGPDGNLWFLETSPGSLARTHAF